MSTTTAKRRTDLDLLRHIWKNVSRDNATGCWEWLMSRDARGYGQIYARRLNESRPIKTHRAVWLLFHGEIPDGLHLHHSCENTTCCSPDHLELLTPAEHSNKHHDPDYCPRGHFFDEANTAYKTRRGKSSRICRACDAERKARARASYAEKYTYPCVWCGAPANTNPRSPGKPPECRPCFDKHSVPNPGKPGRISGARMLAA